ncbi:MAG: hypothetical protein VR64_00930 [Desulfatitalea sp. BRH_c12]|nr:MAG: hypothetical protein VR64_00930 [Desulfatitalea sp. BRH_c12]
MRRKMILFVILSLMGVTSSSAGDLLAPIYPGAVSFGSDRPGHFLTKDSFEQVKKFYAGDKGPATSEKNHKELGRSVFFQYMSAADVHKYDPVGSAIGVHVTVKSTEMLAGEPESSLPVVGDILGRIKMLMMRQNNPNMDAYHKLVNQYRHLSGWYFPLSDKRDASGRLMSMDKVVVALCEQGPSEETSRHAMEAMTKKAEDLMMQGRQREALEILQNVGQAAQNEYARATGSDGIEKWKACLEQLKEHGYPTQIEIALDPSHRSSQSN